ncbi:MAG: TIGR01459 family HAD-type hydrolase [Hirschia sp.]|nr:TIGR01459 family HAD-type hydrolase [Hirschia sp.]MBF19637.1 TIGR01459 family HAD-type hydrolase [Hirschia sp.]
MIDPPRLATLGEIAHNYDAVLCDVWGVVHNGRMAFAEAVEALQRFRAEHGPVILITNAPRPQEYVTRLFPGLGVMPDSYDAVVSSGDAARFALEGFAPGPVYQIGPDFDDPLYEGIELEFTEKAGSSAVVCCTGLRHLPDDEPTNYHAELEELSDLGVPMICANPDIVFRFGDKLVWAAGSLAQIYEQLGGRVIRPGKPDGAIYDLAFTKLEELEGRKPDRTRVLAIGDGPATDVKGAMREDLDCMFIGGGIHGDAFEDPEDFIRSAHAILTNEEAEAAYAAPALLW